MPAKNVIEIRKEGDERRRHPRRWTFRSASLYPVANEAPFSTAGFSGNILSGECMLTLELGQQVHVSFDAGPFFPGEVAWLNGNQYGLLMEEAFLSAEVTRADVDALDAATGARVRLLTSAPEFAGAIRNMSAEGMMIEVANLREGTRILVKATGCDARVGRIEWSSGEMIGIFFEQSPQQRAEGG